MSASKHFSFDTLIDRRGSGSIKWDRRPDLDPFWIADMDFTSPPAVLEVLQERVQFGVFGYANAHDGVTEAIVEYLEGRHQAKVDPDSILHLGGLVSALSLAARMVGETGDELITCTPVYPPFLEVAHDAGMKTVAVPHVRNDDGQWSFDWQGLEQAVTNRSKLFLLCNPQNPLGRAFSTTEVTKIAEFCERHDLVLVSDEIHCDLILDETDENPFATALRLPEALRSNLITLQAPSKTYNIAGMGYAFAVIENDSLRRKFVKAKGHTTSEINCLAFYSAEAAYRHGEPWRQELLAYLRRNRDTLTSFVRAELPQLIVTDIEATYLAWMDCEALGLSNPAVHLEKVGLWVSDGSYFGSPQCIRFNFGCPHARVEEGLAKMRSGFLDLRRE